MVVINGCFFLLLYTVGMFDWRRGVIYTFQNVLPMVKEISIMHEWKLLMHALSSTTIFVIRYGKESFYCLKCSKCHVLCCGKIFYLYIWMTFLSYILPHSLPTHGSGYETVNMFYSLTPTPPRYWLWKRNEPCCTQYSSLVNYITVVIGQQIQST